MNHSCQCLKPEARPRGLPGCSNAWLVSGRRRRELRRHGDHRGRARAVDSNVREMLHQRRRRMYITSKDGRPAQSEGINRYGGCVWGWRRWHGCCREVTIVCKCFNLRQRYGRVVEMGEIIPSMPVVSLVPPREEVPELDKELSHH